MYSPSSSQLPPPPHYSSLAAGRPVVASIDTGTEIPRLLEASGGGVAVPPGDLDAFVDAIRSIVDDPSRAAQLGSSGRSWVVEEASPAAVADAYERLFSSVSGSEGLPGDG